MSGKKKTSVISPTGLAFHFLENSSIRSIEADPIRISIKPATSFTKGGSNLYLRKRGKRMEFIPLLGPESNSRFSILDNAYIAAGNWHGLDYTCALRLSEKSHSWQWQIDITNNSEHPVELDLIYVQDIGLKPATNGLVNEYYVAQYLERRILEDTEHGAVICCRQNMKEPTGHPWLMMACRDRAIAASVDGMTFYGKTFRETGVPEGLHAETLGGESAGESPVLAIQEMPFELTTGGDHHQSRFIATYMPDHPLATSEEDLERLIHLKFEFEDAWEPPTLENLVTGIPNILNTAGFLPVDDLTDEELDQFFGVERRHPETENGSLLSFFHNGNNHVVMRAKEILADRPHAHIIQAGPGFTPDAKIASTTAFAFGIFNSHCSQGNTNFNVLLSICNSQFNLEPETGQRIIVEVEGRHYLLGIPSAFEMGLNHCRWIYKIGDHCFQVRSWSSKTAPQINLDFQVLSGKKVKLMVTHDFDRLNGWAVLDGQKSGEFLAKPASGSMITSKFPGAQFRFLVQSCDGVFTAHGDEALYSDRNGHGDPLFILKVDDVSSFCMSIVCEVAAAYDPLIITDADSRWRSDCRDGEDAWKRLSLNLAIQGDQEDLRAISEILPWFGMNALTHYLTPYGLEQFSGAAWGTRDISQGPFDLLLSMGQYDVARNILRILFSNQNPDGGWPQWWMFDSYSNIRSDEAHGDIIYWTIIALSNYIKVTGDFKILDEPLPYHPEKSDTPAEITPLREHVNRLIAMITASFIPGTALVPFGGGDWNDSLQPVSSDLARRMISSWTVEMNFQAFDQYRVVCEKSGETEQANELAAICERIRTDFNSYLVKDGIVAGYGLVEEDLSISVLLHPVDDITHIHYSILPMNRGVISELFTREQALLHQDLVEYHLKGPDGARLMDRPLKYRGGIQTIFQRAESSTFFGREIGLMYVHEHIRYAESQARTGRAEAFVKALRQANPVAYRNIVPCGDIRQSNCYYSSSDVTFKNRYEADERYDEIKTGRITLKGGWRVYSSGPGIYIGLVVSRLLGLRIEFNRMIIDPVMTKSMDGVSASLDLMGHQVTFRYAVKKNSFAPSAITINGKEVTFDLEENKYRQGGAVIPIPKFLEMLGQKMNVVEIHL